MHPATPYFLRTARLGFRTWEEEDLPLALSLWGDPAVSRFITKDGFSEEEIRGRLGRLIAEQAARHTQYWPIFQLSDDAHVGCCGLRTRPGETIPEFGVHLRPQYWGQRFALEAGRAAIAHGFHVLRYRAIFAGHHPENAVSAEMLKRLGFRPTHLELYPPTGLLHPCYLLLNPHKTRDTSRHPPRRHPR